MLSGKKRDLNMTISCDFATQPLYYNVNLTINHYSQFFSPNKHSKTRISHTQRVWYAFPQRLQLQMRTF